MNKDLKHDFYKLPEELLDTLNSNLKRTSDKANGDKLTRERKIVDGNKRVKMNAGLNNQFKKPHTKDTSKNSSKVRLVSTQKTSDEILNNRAVYNEASRIRDIINKIII
jgi:hypothetical protein